MKTANLIFASIGIAGLIAVRVFEDELFYDPFLNYFRGDFHGSEFPEFHGGKIIVNYVGRFLLNTFFSAWVLHFFFQNKRWTLQSILLMGVVFVVLFPVYLWCVYSRMEIGSLFTFSVRKFIIHPVLLLLLTAVYYYKSKTEQPKK